MHRAISLVATLGLFWPIFKTWNTIVSVPSAGLASIALFAGALWLAGAIATAKDEATLNRLDHWLLALALLALAAWAAGTLEAQSGYGTDEAAFEQGAANLLLHGHNPYGANLIGTLSEFGVPTKYATYTMSGGMVSTFGYPAFPLLLAAVFVKLTGGGQAVQLADVFALMAATVVMFKQLPSTWRGLAIVLCAGFPILTTFALSGLNTVLALPLLLVAAHRWMNTGARGALMRDGRLRAAAFGLALATNQLAWFVAPFLVCGIYVVRRSDIGARLALKVALAYLGVALGTFALVNAPFFLWGPSAWLTGVAAPLTQHAVPYGQGLVGLTLFLRAGGGALDAYNYAAGFLYVALLIAYCLRFRTLGRACFILPLGALFISGRSLAGYWMIAAPLIAVGALTAEDSVLSGVRHVRRWGSLPLKRPAVVALFLPAVVCLGLALATPQPLAIRVLGARSDTRARSVDQLRVEVRNRSDNPLRPHFATNVSGQPVFWSITRGPSLLRPDASAVYVLRLPDVASQPPNGMKFMVEAVTGSPRTISSAPPFAQRGPAQGYW